MQEDLRSWNFFNLYAVPVLTGLVSEFDRYKRLTRERDSPPDIVPGTALGTDKDDPVYILRALERLRLVGVNINERCVEPEFVPAFRADVELFFQPDGLDPTNLCHGDH